MPQSIAILMPGQIFMPFWSFELGLGLAEFGGLLMPLLPESTG
jgi:hypothetical protein